MNICMIYARKFENVENKEIVGKLRAKGHEVSIIDSSIFLSQSHVKTKVGKVKILILTVQQCVKALWNNQKTDIFICWSLWTGVVLNIIAPSKYNIISMGWLTPKYNGFLQNFFKKAILNKRTYVVVNSNKTKDDIIRFYKLKNEDKSNVVYIPDVYDSNDKIIKPTINNKEKYVFCGGMSNRDWDTFIGVAKKCSDVNFVGVALEKDWNSNLIIPENCKMYFDVTPEEYYKLLENCYITFFPLVDDRVAGLINIIKSFQYGKLCLVSDIEATRAYYPPKMRDIGLLVPIKNIEYSEKSIKKLMTLSDSEYLYFANELQVNLMVNFSPTRIVNDFSTIINNIGNENLIVNN